MPSSPSIFSKPGWLNCGKRLLWGRLRTSSISSTFESRRSLTNSGKSRLEWPTVKRDFTPLESGSEPELRATKTPCYGLILPQGCDVNGGQFALPLSLERGHLGRFSPVQKLRARRPRSLLSGAPQRCSLTWFRATPHRICDTWSDAGRGVSGISGG